jgi:hypothetical protein
MPLTGPQRALYGRIGAALARSRHDVRELTAAGRAAFLERFERDIREQSPNLSDSEVQRRAGEARRAHMLQLALKSSIVRGKKRTTPAAHADAAQESNGASATTRSAPPE